MTIRAHEPSYILRMNAKIRYYGMFLDNKLRLHYQGEDVPSPQIKKKPKYQRRKTFAEIIEHLQNEKK